MKSAAYIIASMRTAVGKALENSIFQETALSAIAEQRSNT